jgi:hypothetical protein
VLRFDRVDLQTTVLGGATLVLIGLLLLSP